MPLLVFATNGEVILLKFLVVLIGRTVQTLSLHVRLNNEVLAVRSAMLVVCVLLRECACATQDTITRINRMS